METVYLNAVVISLFATWFIPATIRDPHSGEFLGFAHGKFLGLLAALTLVESFVVSQSFGFGLEALVRVIAQVLIAAFAGLIFMKYTHPRLFGSSINFTKWW
jgi:hypothetical protein